MLTFKELSKYELEQNGNHAFGLSSTGFRLALLGNTKYVNSLNMTPFLNQLELFPYKTDSITLPRSRPTSELVNSTDMSKILREATITDRQTMTLDPWYAAEFSMQPVDPVAKSVNWLPNKRIPAVVVLTNYGACEVLAYDCMVRQYTKCLLSFNTICRELETEQNLPDDFKKLNEAINRRVITACCWKSEYTNDTFIFYCANAAGWIYVFEVTPWTAKLLCKTKTDLGQITSVTSCKNLLVAFGITGLISAFKITPNGIEEADKLWSRVDRLSCPKVLVNFCAKYQKYFVCTCKGSHFLVFVLNHEGNLERKSRFYAGNVIITDFDCISPTEYIVATFSGRIEHIQILLNDTDIQLVANKVQTAIDTKNYTIQGLVASPNKNLWTFLLHPIRLQQPSKSKHIHNSVTLTISSLDNAYPLHTVLKIGQSLKTEDAIDGFAQIRLEIIENQMAKDYYKFSPQPVQISNDFLNRLRLKLFIVNAIGTYNRLKFKQRGNKNEAEKSAHENLIQMVNLCRRMTHITSLPVRTAFQNLVGKCALATLKLLQKFQDGDDETCRMVQILHPLIDTIIEQNEHTFNDVQDFCVYCNAPIDFETLSCTGGHQTKRCGVSCVQVPMFTTRECPQCHLLTLEDDDLLKSILSEDEELQCPYCGWEFISVV